MSRFAIKVAAAAALVGLAACSENKVGLTEPDVAVSHAVVPVLGASWNSFVTNNSGPEFWDNLSVDGVNCNVGWYAGSGPFGGSSCAYQIPGAPVAGGTFLATQFWGNAGGTYSAPIMFDAGTYNVTFLDGYRGAIAEQVGYFTKSGGTYTLTEIDPLTSGGSGGFATFTTTAPWGLWIQPVTPISGGAGCGVAAFPNAMCSDDARVQQFAMFRRAGDDSQYLVGIEDQPGVPTRAGILPTSSQFPVGGGDKDFNDFFLSVRKAPPTETLDGRMTGGATNKDLNIKAALTIHCDNKLSNNIQINGPNKLDWHLDKNSLTNIVCQRTADPAPPVAPINIFNGDATGTLNGVPGSKLTFSFIDRGEPGKNDTFSLVIYNPGGGVAFTTSGQVAASSGNLQAHYDQPHGQKP